MVVTPTYGHVYIYIDLIQAVNARSFHPNVGSGDKQCSFVASTHHHSRSTTPLQWTYLE